MIYLRAVNEDINVDDTEKISAANDKASQAARVDEGSQWQRLTVIQCIEVHIEQNKSLLITFLKQTPDKIFPVVYYLREKIFTPSEIHE